MGSGAGKDEHHDRRGVQGAGRGRSARTAAGAIPIAKDLATKEDLADLRTELKQDIAELRAELKQDIADLRTELTRGAAELRATLRYNTMFLMLVIGLLVKLVFFP